jgi:DNA-binding CsgD family transcriptional regulator
MTWGGPAAQLVSPDLVGRGEEIERVASTLSAPPAVAVVEGEAGIGKTRLVAELRHRPEVAAGRFVVGSCRPIREPLPLAPVIEALRGLVDQLATPAFSPVAGALRPLLPEIADRLPPRPEPLGDRLAERHRVFRAVREVLVSSGPVVLVLEDLHWVDEQTHDLLGYLLADPPSTLGLVLTFRGEDADPRVRGLTAKLPRSVARVDTALSPLGVEQTGRMAAGILGTDHVSREFAQYLCERTAGLPFAIEELLALLRQRGPVPTQGQPGVLADPEVPRAIRDQVLERAGRLSSETRPVIETVAVLQQAVPERLVVAVSGRPDAEVSSGLSEAIRAGLLVEDGDSVGFRHVLAAQAVYGDIPGPRRRLLHDRAAAALDDLRPRPLGRIAHHLRHAGRLDEWAAAAERAADQAAELGHLDEAARLLEEVLRHAPLAAERRGRLAVKLGRAAVDTLPARDVVDLLTGAADRPRTPAVRGELCFLTAVLLDQTRGDIARQRRLCAEAVPDLSARPELKAWAQVSLGIPMDRAVPLSEHVGWLRRALDTLPEISDRAFEVFVLGKVAMVLVGVGDPSWRETADRLVALVNDTPRHLREVNAYYSVGLGACCAGYHELSDRFLATGLAGARECENARLSLMIRSARAMLDYCRGHWDGLAEQVDDLVADLGGYAPARSDVKAVAGSLALARGDLDGAHARLAGVMDGADRGDGLDLCALAASAVVRLALARGDVAGALTDVERLLTGLESKQMWAPVTRALPAMVQAMVAGGRLADARALTVRVARELRGLDAPLGDASLHHARGVVAAAERHWADAGEQLLAAAERYEEHWCRYESAQAREQAATCLVAAGDVADGEVAAGGGRAGPVLQSVMSAYRHLGASWDLDRASRLARRQGLRVPARHRAGRRGYGDRLSPQERRVAKLAATGRTNQEIADELFLSPKTVANHVSAALRKLGLRSRTALAHRLARAGEKDPDHHE